MAVNFASGSSRLIQTGDATQYTSFSCGARLNPSAIATGAIVFGRRSGGNIRFRLQVRATTPTDGFRFTAGRATTDGIWNSPASQLVVGTTVSVLVTYEIGTTTDPLLYVNGTSVTMTETSTPAGGAPNPAGGIQWGNDVSGGDPAQGILEDCVFWNTILDADQAMEWHASRGAAARTILPANLQHWYQLKENPIGSTFTNAPKNLGIFGAASWSGTGGSIVDSLDGQWYPRG